MKTPHVNHIKSMMGSLGNNIDETDYNTLLKALQRHQTDTEFFRVFAENKVEVTFIFIFVLEYYNKSDVGSNDYFVSPTCALDFLIQLIKKDKSILNGFDPHNVSKTLCGFIDDYLDGLDYSKESSSFIEVCQSKDGKYSAMYCNTVLYKGLYLDTMRFRDGFFMLTGISILPTKLPQPTQKSWALSCEGLAQVFSVDEVELLGEPNVLLVRLKHIKKRGLNSVYVEAVCQTTSKQVGSFVVSCVGDKYSPTTLAAYAYYDAAIKFHDQFSHVKVVTNINIQIHTLEKSLAHDLVRIANALFPVSFMVVKDKIVVNKSKIKTKVKIEARSFERLSEILCVNAGNKRRWQFTRHSILRYIERVLINEKLYVCCAFKHLKEAVARHDWREATQYEKDLYGLQIDGVSQAWISDSTPYCFVTQGQHVLTVVVKNFEDALEAANVLRD